MTNATTVATTVATKPRRTPMNILSWTVEDWYWFCQVSSLVLLGATVVLGAGALFAGNVLNKRQASEIATLKESTEKQKGETARANESAGKANESAARAQKETASLYR